MKKNYAPVVVFGAKKEPNKTVVGYVDAAGRAHAHICELKPNNFDVGDAIPRDEIKDAVIGEYVHLWFAKKENLFYFIKNLQALYELMEKEGAEK